ncbi:MAG: DUF167 domain-containing protein [Candidatus Competibacterales bacterium]
MGRLAVKVIPGSSRDAVVGWRGEALRIKLRAPPEQGRANRALVALLAAELNLAPGDIAVVKGHTSPHKVVAIQGLDDHQIKATFAGLVP